MKRLFAKAVIALPISSLPPVAIADLYAAKAAYEKQDYAAAFAEFKASAELGHPMAQESLAIMYASGQGVPRDGIRAYAWAQVARENGAGDRAQVIVDQLQQFVTPATRQPVDEVHAAFGKQALETRLLPAIGPPTGPAPSGDLPGMATPADKGCQLQRPVNPNKFYPDGAVKRGVSGSVLVETPVQSDGRARNPRVIFAFPQETFDQAGRKVALNSAFSLPDESGARVPCNVTFSAHFAKANLQDEQEARKKLVPLKAAAEAGDPAAQLQYAVIMKAWRVMNPKGENFTWMIVRAAQAGLPSAQYVMGFGALNGAWFRKDREKGVRWLEMAIAGGQIEARVDLAKALLRDKPGSESIPRARELLEAAAQAGSKDGRYFLADLLLGDPDASRRDPGRALKMLLEEYRLEDPSLYELRAAAYSQTGDFGKAVNNAKEALAMARRLKWDVTPLAERQALYESRQSWVGLLLTY